MEFLPGTQRQLGSFLAVVAQHDVDQRVVVTDIGTRSIQQLAIGQCCYTLITLSLCEAAHEAPVVGLVLHLRRNA